MDLRIFSLVINYTCLDLLTNHMMKLLCTPCWPLSCDKWYKCGNAVLITWCAKKTSLDWDLQKKKFVNFLGHQKIPPHYRLCSYHRTNIGKKISPPIGWGVILSITAGIPIGCRKSIQPPVLQSYRMYWSGLTGGGGEGGGGGEEEFLLHTCLLLTVIICPVMKRKKI